MHSEQIIQIDSNITVALEEQRQNTERQRQLNLLNGVNQSQQRTATTARAHTRELTTQNRLLKNMHTLAAQYVSVFAAGAMIGSLVRISGEFELQRTSLRAILNDLHGADALFERIKSLSVMSPFQFKDLVGYTKQLSAFSVPLNELYDTTKMLADEIGRAHV